MTDLVRDEERLIEERANFLVDDNTILGIERPASPIQDLAPRRAAIDR